MDYTFLHETMFSAGIMNLNDKALELFGPTIRTWWNSQDREKRDVLIDHMVNLFGNTFNKKLVAKLVGKNLK